MINILPPEVKEQRRYGRINRFLLKQLVGVGFTAILAVGFMLSGLRLVENDRRVLQDSIESQTLTYAGLQKYEAEAKQLNQKIKSIESLFTREVRFSQLLQEIAGSIPVNTRLKSLSLTGQKTEVLQIVADVDTQELAAVLRKSLVDSDTFESADILSISPGEANEDGLVQSYDVTIDAEFTGAAEQRAAEKAVELAEAEAAKTAAEAAINGGQQ